MVPSLQLLLLLWGLQGLWAQDYEEDNEEEGVTTRKKNRQFPINFIAQNGKCKSKIVSFLHLSEDVFFSPTDALTWKSGVKYVQVEHVSLFSSPEKKKGAATCEIIEHDTQQGHRWRMQSTWIISLGFL